MEHTNLNEINSKIRSMKTTARELSEMGEDFPALARNTARILASLKMLEINICDVLDAEEQELHPDDC
ncbi:hypothetical protein QUF80_15550 [Desulfococcaceae bacterium HSG8]|nr:hypothetical protein [Desulfococcaceae bacterium HSG8]